eukprot:COSAG01_NODE_45202_length_411_cov_1.477564_1_plen_40_part_10
MIFVHTPAIGEGEHTLGHERRRLLIKVPAAAGHHSSRSRC